MVKRNTINQVPRLKRFRLSADADDWNLGDSGTVRNGDV